MVIAGSKMANVLRDIAHRIVVRQVSDDENAELAFQIGQQPLEVRVLDVPGYCGVQDASSPSGYTAAVDVPT